MSERVHIAQNRISRSPVVLKACGLGSCLAVGLYDPESRFGALGHMLLPKHPQKKQSCSAGKYVDTGIRLMVNEMIRAGARYDSLVAKITGGANMFESSNHTLIDGIGARNAKSAKETLNKLAIPLLGAQVGGNRGRTVEFDLATGDMVVYCARVDEQVSF